MLKNQMLIERASLLNDDNKHSLVLATTLPSLPAKPRISAYTCKACHAEFASNAGSAPYCVNCGAEDVEQTPENAMPDVPEDDKDLMAVQCRNHECGTYNIVHAKLGGMMDGVMHCVTCGTILAYDNPFNDGKKAPADTRPAEGKKGTPADTRPAEGKKGTPADTRPDDDENDLSIQRASEDDDFEERPFSQQADESGDSEFEQDNAGDADEEDVTLVAPMETSEVDEDDLIDPETASDDDFGMDSEQEACDDEVPMQMTAAVLANYPRAAFNVISTGDKILATLNDIHVATLSKEHAGENADIFYSKSFASAIQQMASIQGAKVALAHFGFKPVVLKFPQKKTVAALIKRKVTAAAEQLQDKEEQVSEDLEQCVSIAAAGLNRNFFAKHKNVLRSGFVQAMTTAGVQNADRVVASVFNRYADEYHRTLLAVAAELMKKPLDVRNELAAAIGDVNPGQQADKAPEQEQEQDNESLEARVQAAVRPTKSVQTASITSIHQVREATGGSLFSR